MGGAGRQTLMKMLDIRHKALHRELNDFLEHFVSNGRSMRPTRGNSGALIRQTFSRSERLEALAAFYKGSGHQVLTSSAGLLPAKSWAMILGYIFVGVDNGTRMFERDDARRHYCHQCGRPVGDKEINPDFSPRKRFDVSATADNRIIVSAGVAEVLIGRGAILVPLPAAPGCFELRASDILEFDAERSGARFLDRCSVCERYYDVVGIDPLRLKNPYRVPLPDRLFRTDLCFGSGDEQSPLLLTGPSLGRELLAYESSGADLVAVEE